MRALVTGGGGFLGRYIVEKLQARGDRVRILARGAYPELADAGVDCRRGDLRTPQDVRDACADIDTVFHVAALAGLWGNRKRFFEINCQGTVNVIDACRQAGVRKLVYTSSPSVVFGMDDLEGVDATIPYPKRYYANYPASKAAAEQRVLAADGPDLATCSLRPHLVWGPRDHHIIALLVERARSGQLIQIGDGTNRVDLTYVENAADAHLQAADALAPGKGPAGKAYFIADAEPVTMWDWIRDFLDRAGLPPIRKTIPYSTAYAIGAAMEILYTALPFLGEPRLTRFVASQFAKSHYFDWSAATRDFGYRPAVSNDEGLRRTVAWLNR